MTDICSFLNQYVPEQDSSDSWQMKPLKILRFERHKQAQKILSGGDYLTFERQKQAQKPLSGGDYLFFERHKQAQKILSGGDYLTFERHKQAQKILSGGDYLTVEQHKQAQASKRDGRAPSKRLEVLILKMEQLNNECEFLAVSMVVTY